jgi:HlyD family secretion protein
VNVDEADVGKVRAGQKATFVVSAYPNRTYEASITQVRYGSPTVSGVVTYETVLKVDNADLSLRPGMTATADIQVQTVENALLLPNAALRFTPPVEEAKTSGSLLGSLLPRPPGSPDKKVEENGAGQKSKKVWQLKDGQLTPISVLTGVTDGTYTEIVEGGLVPGDAMVVDVALGSK